MRQPARSGHTALLQNPGYLRRQPFDRGCPLGRPLFAYGHWQLSCGKEGSLGVGQFLTQFPEVAIAKDQQLDFPLLSRKPQQCCSCSRCRLPSLRHRRRLDTQHLRSPTYTEGAVFCVFYAGNTGVTRCGNPRFSRTRYVLATDRRASSARPVWRQHGVQSPQAPPRRSRAGGPYWIETTISISTVIWLGKESPYGCEPSPASRRRSDPCELFFEID